MSKRCFAFFGFTVSLFIIFTPLFAADTQIPQQVLDWQKTAQELTAQGDLSGAARCYEKILSSSTLSLDYKSLPTMFGMMFAVVSLVLLPRPGSMIFLSVRRAGVK